MPLKLNAICNGFRCGAFVYPPLSPRFQTFIDPNGPEQPRQREDITEASSCPSRPLQLNDQAEKPTTRTYSRPRIVHEGQADDQSLTGLIAVYDNRSKGRHVPEADSQGGHVPEGGSKGGHVPEGGSQIGHAPEGGSQDGHEPEGGRKDGHVPEGGSQHGHASESDSQDVQVLEGASQDGHVPEGGSQDSHVPEGGSQDGVAPGVFSLVFTSPRYLLQPGRRILAKDSGEYIPLLTQSHHNVYLLFHLYVKLSKAFRTSYSLT